MSLQIKVNTAIYIEVVDHDQAEEACSEINNGLARVMEAFPEGEVVAVDVVNYELASGEDLSRFAE